MTIKQYLDLVSSYKTKMEHLKSRYELWNMPHEFWVHKQKLKELHQSPYACFLK